MRKTMFRISILSLAAMSLFSPIMSAVVSEPVSNNSSVPSDATVNNALNELKSLSHKEKTNKIKEVKKIIKKYKKDKREGSDVSQNTILLAILAILLPPLAIWLKEGTLTWKFWLCIALYVFTFVSWGFLSLPIILALLVVFNVL